MNIHFHKVSCLALVVTVALAACSRSEPNSTAPQSPAVTAKQADEGLREFLNQPQTHVRTIEEIRAEQKAAAASSPRMPKDDHAQK
jgi:hypothetical protein